MSKHPIHSSGKKDMNDSQKTLFNTMPLCEACEKSEAVSFSLINQQWQFTCYCTAEKESYYIEFDQYFSRPSETVDWMAHLHAKPWMDWNNFMSMICRFRKKIGLFNG